MSKLAALKACTSVGDLAALLGFSAKALGYISRGLDDKLKYTSFEIPKRSGGTRTIHAPIPQLKLAQRRLAKLLEDCLTEIETTLGVKNRLAHGFRKKHSILTNASVHRGQRFVLNFDLSDFFGTISFSRVLGFFLKNRHFELDRNVALLVAQLSCHEKRLPQGSPTSPIISNLIGGILDIRLAKIARAHGCAYSRYADDISISTSAPEFPIAIANRTPSTNSWTLSKTIVDAVSACGFSINPSKTRVLYRPSRQDVTGIVVNRHVNVNSTYRRKLRAMVDRLRSTGSYVRKRSELDGTGSTKLKDKAGTLNQLRGMLAYPIQVERFRLGSAPLPASRTGNENLLRRFLFYTTFANASRPLILAEGKTDNIYLAAAIRSLAPAFPALSSASSEELLIRFLRSTASFERLFGLTGGQDPLQKFASQYGSEYRPIKGPKGTKPVILLLDNDNGGLQALNHIRNYYKFPTPDGPQYFYVAHNLYVVLSSPMGGPSHCIEDCFDASTRAETLSGKTLHIPSKGFDKSKHYGKAMFAEHVIKPKQKTIDFSGFKNILGAISQIISNHATSVKASKQTTPLKITEAHN